MVRVAWAGGLWGNEGPLTVGVGPRDLGTGAPDEVKVTTVVPVTVEVFDTV